MLLRIRTLRCLYSVESSRLSFHPDRSQTRTFHRPALKKCVTCRKGFRGCSLCSAKHQNKLFEIRDSRHRSPIIDKNKRERETKESSFPIRSLKLGSTLRATRVLARRARKTPLRRLSPTERRFRSIVCKSQAREGDMAGVITHSTKNETERTTPKSISNVTQWSSRRRHLVKDRHLWPIHERK